MTEKRFRIKTLDRIAEEGLALFDGGYAVRGDEADPGAIVVRSSPVDTDGYPSLLAVARAGSGVNNITVEKATEQGICVFNTPGANANAVAELVFTMLGVAVRNIGKGMDFCRGLAGLAEDEIRRQVEAGKNAYRGMELAGKTLGVVGLGKIGVRVANIGIMHRMKVIGFDPLPALENVHALSSEVLLSRSLREVVRSADILTVHVPVDEKTRGMVDRELISGMPEGALLVNYARGQIVDEPAVLEALSGGRLGGYITDFPSSANLGHPKVVATPHLGASTEESEEHCAVMAVEQIKNYLERGTVTNSVNFPTAEHIPSDGVRCRLIMINRDVPGMIGFASQTIGASGINIASYLNESNGTVGYNIIDLEGEMPNAVLTKIQAHPGVIRTRLIRCGER